MIKYILSSLFLLGSLAASAEEAAGPQMADAFRQDGKIYVVITVISMVLFAIVALLIYIERKLKKLEGQVKERGTTDRIN